MKAKYKLLSLFVVLILAVMLIAPSIVSAAGTTIVKPSAPMGWGILSTGDLAVTTNNASGKIVAGPGGQPGGLLPGSIEYNTKSSPGGKPQLYAPASLAGVKFSTLTSLSYRTYISQYASGGAWLVHAINVRIDLDGNLSGTTTDRYTMVYEPCYSTSCASAIQPLNTWATWDALAPGAIWWSTGSIAGTAFTIPFNSFAPLTSIYEVYPDAVISYISFQAGQSSGGAPWDDFIGYLDGVVIEIDGDITTYDFEPEPPCTTVCYVDAANGNDANGGASIGDAKKTIQAAIDAVSESGQVRVLPGNYSETATNRWVLGMNGPHQFGLFIDKDGVTIQGVDASDANIPNYSSVAATITTNATNNFGYSGIFVQGNHVTIAGLRIGSNTPSNNKTIEVIGDAFTLKDSHIDVSSGAVYFGDWQYDAVTNTSSIESYAIEGNLFDDGTLISVNSGAGYSGNVIGRSITNNVFIMAGANWPAISFTGSGTAVPWFVNPVGGAIITGNSFSGSTQYIRSRGTVREADFDWVTYWNNNTFDKKVMAGPNPPSQPRGYTYMSGSYSMPNTKRIGAVIQEETGNAQNGDTVLVGAGTYMESPNINKPLTLKSSDGSELTIIQLQTGPTYLGALTINGDGATIIDGFTIAGFDATESGLASSNIYLTTLPDDVTIRNNRIKVGAIGTGSNGDDGFGLITTYSLATDVSNLVVSGNIFEPLNTSGARAFYVNPGVNQFVFSQNEVIGNFTRTAITQAKNGIVEENTLTGVGDPGNRSKGLGTWGYPDPTIYGHTIFRNNTISGVTRGVSINATNSITVENNFFADNDVAVWMGDTEALLFDPATIHINENSILNSNDYGVQNASAQIGVTDSKINWWGSNLASNVAAEVSGNVDYTPWLCSGTDTSTDPGFQPSLQTNCSVFSGFFQPIDMNAPNLAKAGQTIPVKWRLTDANGAPISDPAMFAGLISYNVSCTETEGVPDAIETYSGSSGLQYLGDGYWQFNWKTPKSYANTCRSIYIQFTGGFQSPEVDFKFKP